MSSHKPVGSGDIFSLKSFEFEFLERLEIHCRGFQEVSYSRSRAGPKSWAVGLEARRIEIHSKLWKFHVSFCVWVFVMGTFVKKTKFPNSVPFMEETPDTACGGSGILAHPIYSPINVVKQAINTVRPNRMGARTTMVIYSSSSLLYSVSRQKSA